MPERPHHARPSARITLLDGGTGEELFRRGVPDDRRIWSARALVEERYHEIVRQVHEAFILAGSQTITTCNYAVTPGVGLGDRLEELTALAARLAAEARARCEERGFAGVRICGSLPPLIESYRPDLVLPREKAAPIHARIARALRPAADVFLAETMSSIEEARSAVLGAREVDPDKEIWVSFTLGADGRLRSGEPAPVAVDSLLGEGVSAILFNCSEPEAIGAALAALRAAADIDARRRAAGVRLGAYANRLTPVPADFAIAATTAPQAMRDDLDPARYADHVASWIALGAELVGGCCGIGPEYIRELGRRFQGRMAAVEYERGRGLTLVTREVPRPGEGEVLLEIMFAGVCGSDLHVLQGTSRYRDRVVLGHEAVGRVAALGAGVPDSLAIGDVVALCPQYECGQCARCLRGQPNFCERGGYGSTIGYFRDGCHAEHCVAPSSQLHPVPPSIGVEEAVLCEPMSCILHGWNKLGDPPRDARILIMGAGIFGLLWASLFHARGYRRGVLTEPLPGRRRIAADLCAGRLAGFEARAPAELGEDDRFELIVECCGAAEAVADGYRRLDVGGRLLVFGGPPKGSSITIDPSDLLFKELTLCGSVLGQGSFQEGMAALAELSAAGYLRFEELGVARFALSDHAAAFQAVAEGAIAKAIFAVR